VILQGLPLPITITILTRGGILYAPSAAKLKPVPLVLSAGENAESMITVGTAQPSYRMSPSSAKSPGFVPGSDELALHARGKTVEAEVVRHMAASGEIVLCKTQYLVHGFPLASEDACRRIGVRDSNCDAYNHLFLFRNGQNSSDYIREMHGRGKVDRPEVFL
jgi:hypothetical protein